MSIKIKTPKARNTQELIEKVLDFFSKIVELFDNNEV